jgi:hypothetical protein
LSNRCRLGDHSVYPFAIADAGIGLRVKSAKARRFVGDDGQHGFRVSLCEQRTHFSKP